MRNYLSLVLLLTAFASPAARAEVAAASNACAGTHDFPKLFDADEMASDVLNANRQSQADALKTAMSLIARHAKSWVTYALAADVEVAAGRPDLAELHYRKAIELAGYSPYRVSELERSLAYPLYLEQKDAELIALMDRLVKQACAPFTDMEILHYAEALESAGRLQDAARALSPLLAGDKTPFKALLVNIELACNLQQYEACARTLVRAAKRNEDLPEDSRIALQALAPKLQKMAAAREVLLAAQAAGTFGPDWAIPKPDVTELVPDYAASPEYPLSASRALISGFVDLRLKINERGRVIDASVIKSVPTRVFDQAAISAAWRSSFKPKIVNGKAVATSGVRRYEFIMR